MQRKPVNQQALSEWIESPVTREVLNLLADALQELQEDRLNAYVPGEPEKTQEFLARCLGRHESLDLATSLLEGDWGDYFEEQDESERDTPET